MGFLLGVVEVTLTGKLSSLKFTLLPNKKFSAEKVPQQFNGVAQLPSSRAVMSNFGGSTELCEGIPRQLGKCYFWGSCEGVSSRCSPVSRPYQEDAPASGGMPKGQEVSLLSLLRQEHPFSNALGFLCFVLSTSISAPCCSGLLQAGTDLGHQLC